MRIIKKTLILVMTIFAAVTIFLKTDVKAESLGTENIQKIVSVVYDNSGSMKAGDTPTVDPTVKKARYRYATYALQMLIGLLNDNDKLIINPMNDTKGNWKGEGIEVDLTGDVNDPNKRNKVIEDLFYNPTTSTDTNVEGKIPIVTGGNTPFNSVNNAIESFKKITNGKGLPTSEEYTDEDKNTEYWLVILTDGVFNEYVNKTKENLSEDLITLLKDYGHLNTIYYAFGSQNDIHDLRNTTITKQLSFTAYSAEDGDAIINSMQEIANRLSRRFELEQDYVTYDDYKVIIDLNQYSTNAIAFKSLSIIAQNSAVKLKSVKYNGNDISNYLLRPCILDNQDIDDMKDGYLAVLGMPNVFNGGTIELEFTSSVVNTGKKNYSFESGSNKDKDKDKSPLKDKVHILVEPALSIVPYFTYNNDVVDMEYVNSTLKPGDSIKANYKIVNPMDGSEITNLEMFGTATSKVTYLGPGLMQGLTYGINEDIKLVSGRNTINIEVVFGGKYTLLTSTLCVVEVNPTIYKIEGETLNNTNQVKFEVFHENNQKNKNELKEYQVMVTLTDPSGKETVYDNIFNYPNQIKVNDNGEIIVDVDIENQKFGRYEVSCKVIFSEADRIVRTNKQFILKMPNVIEVRPEPSEMVIGEFNLQANQEKVMFGVYGDGNLINIDSYLFDYKVEVDGVDITSKAVIKRTQGIIEIIPNTANLPNSSVGNKEIKVTITRKDNNQSIIGKCNLTIEATRYEIELLTKEPQSINIYDTKNVNAEVRFKIYRNDVSLTVSELYEFYDKGTLKIDTNSFGWLSLLPYGVEIDFEIVNGEPEIVCKVEKDWLSLFKLDSLCASFIFAESKDIEVSYGGVKEVATIYMNPVTMGSRIVKWLVLLLYVLIVTHLTLYVLGFVILKPFRKGTIVSIELSEFGDDAYISTKKVNRSQSNIVKWHLKRFIPFKELTPQKPIKFGDIGQLAMINGKMKVVFKKEVFRTEIHIPGDTYGGPLRDFITSLKNNFSGTEPDVLKGSRIKSYLSNLEVEQASLKGKNKVKNKKHKKQIKSAVLRKYPKVYVVQGETISGGKMIESITMFVQYK